MIKSLIQNKFLEINFILFPIWILPVYFLMKFFILPPELTFLIFLILLGETHFASTFLFYFNKQNRRYIKKNKTSIVFMPIFLCICFFIFGMKHFEHAVLIGAVASGIHVTRQSIGISRLYSTGKNIVFEILIYFSSFLFLFIGFTRFYQKDYLTLLNIFKINKTIIENFNFLLTSNSLLILLVSFLAFLSLFEKTHYKKKLVNLTGVLIYSPYLFVNNVYDAIVIGVGAHWSQYLLLNYKIYFFKEQMDYKKILQIVFIFLYALVMGLLGINYYFDKSILHFLILVPFTFQFFHYYVDAFIWRFSVKEIRENIGYKLFS